jgi:hypothetical protein
MTEQLHAEVERCFLAGDINGLLLALAPKLKAWAISYAMGRFDSRHLVEELYQEGYEELLGAVPRMLGREMEGALHIIRSARLAAIWRFEKLLNERPAFHACHWTLMADRRQGRTTRYVHRITFDEQFEDDFFGWPSDAPSVSSSEYQFLLEEVRAKALAFSTGATHRGIELMLAAPWSESQRRRSVPTLAKLARTLGMPRQTLADQLRGLAVPIASAVTAETAEIGRRLYGARWPEISRKCAA